MFLGGDTVWGGSGLQALKLLGMTFWMQHPAAWEGGGEMWHVQNRALTCDGSWACLVKSEGWVQPCTGCICFHRMGWHDLHRKFLCCPPQRATLLGERTVQPVDTTWSSLLFLSSSKSLKAQLVPDSWREKSASCRFLGGATCSLVFLSGPWRIHGARTAVASAASHPAVRSQLAHQPQSEHTGQEQREN